MTSRAVAVAFWVYVGTALVFLAVVSQETSDVGTLSALVGLGAAGLVTLWVTRDAGERGERVDGLAVVVLVLPLVAVPVYLVRSRGWGGGALSALRIAGLAVVTGGAVVAVETLVLIPLRTL